MLTTRKNSVRTPASHQEIIYQTIDAIISAGEEDGAVPTPALFINTKYAEAKVMLNKLLSILPSVNLTIQEEKAKHAQEWLDSFKSRDTDLQQLADQRDKSSKLIESMSEEFRVQKVALEEEKKKIREEKERLATDEQRKATLVSKKRTENLGNLTAQKIELDKKSEVIEGKAGCCGLSKKKKKALADLKAAEKTVDEKIQEVKEMKDSDFSIFDEEFDRLEKNYQVAKKNLNDYVASFPKKIQAEKDNLDAIEVSFNQKENDFQVIQNRFSTYVSNTLMFQLLKMYVIYKDFYDAVKRIDSSRLTLVDFKEKIAESFAQIEQSLSVLWCPNSKDRSSGAFLSLINQNASLKQILIANDKLAEEDVQKVVPQAPGRILNRLKKGELTGVEVRPGDVVSFPELASSLSRGLTRKIK